MVASDHRVRIATAECLPDVNFSEARAASKRGSGAAVVRGRTRIARSFFGQRVSIPDKDRCRSPPRRLNLLRNQWLEVGAFWLATCTVPSRSHLVQRPVKGYL